MEYINIGKIITTHGIKGELKIISTFQEKDQVFKKDFNIYIGNNHQLETINTHRVHKNYNMITLNNYTNINEVLTFLKQNVYVLRSDLEIKDYLLEDIINMDIILNKEILGKITEIIYNKSNILISVTGPKNFYIPYNQEFIKEVDIKNNQVHVNEITKGLII